MRYLHDPRKQAANLKKHGYDFTDAPQVIENPASVTLGTMSIGEPLHPGHWSMGPTGREWKGPEPYHIYNITGPFGRLQSDLYRTLNVHIRLHQFAYAPFRVHDKRLDEIAAELKAENSGEPEDFEQREALMVWKSRRMNLIFTEDEDLDRSVQTINRMVAVTLWALAEQYLGKVFQKLASLRTGNPIESVTAPYRWDSFRSAYPSEGIVLDTLHDYALANECRVLNNHIKHSPLVSNKLATFSPFNAFLGKSLDQVAIDPQRYLNGVSNFLGSLIEHANALHSKNG